MPIKEQFSASILKLFFIRETGSITIVKKGLWNVMEDCGPDPIKILQPKFYTTLFFQAFWLDSQIGQPNRMLKNCVA